MEYDKISGQKQLILVISNAIIHVPKIGFGTPEKGKKYFFMLTEHSDGSVTCRVAHSKDWRSLNWTRSDVDCTWL